MLILWETAVPFGTIEKYITLDLCMRKAKNESTWDIYLEIFNSVKISVFGD